MEQAQTLVVTSLFFQLVEVAITLAGKKAVFLNSVPTLQYLRAVEGSNDQRGLLSIFVYPNYSIKTIYPSLNIGYRKYKGNVLFRIGFSPGIIKKEFIPGGYLSFGLTF